MNNAKTRVEKTIRNSSAELIVSIVSVILLFAITRLTITRYGDDYNGLLGLLASLIGYLTLIDSGISAVVAKRLYRPLRENNDEEISQIYKSSKTLLRKIGFTMIAFSILITILMPMFVDVSKIKYPQLIIIAYLIRQFFAYYIYQPNLILISATQSKYKLFNGKLFLNLFILSLTALLLFMELGQFWLIILIWSSLTLLLGLHASWYVRKNFNINKSKNFKKISIFNSSKNLIAHRIAELLSNNTDVIILAYYASLYEVSIYSTYMFIIIGLKLIIDPVIDGVRHSIGDLIDSGENKSILRAFLSTCTLIAAFTFSGFILLGNSVISIMFKPEYANSITNTLFATIMFIYIINKYSDVLVNVTEKFSKTKYISIVEAILNISLSLFFISNGIFENQIHSVLVATTIATAFKMIASLAYSHIAIYRNIIGIVKLAVSIIIIATAFFIFGDKIIESSITNIRNLIGSTLIMATTFIAILVVWSKEIIMTIKTIKGDK